PNRSSNQPRTGQVIAVQMAARNTALERSPRVMPSSAETGFRKTLVEKIRIGPEPTNKPHIDAATTSQRLAKSPPMSSSYPTPLRSPIYLLLLDPDDRNDVRGRYAPAFGLAPLRDQAQLARQNATPENDGGIGAPKKLMRAVLDAALAGLYGDVLDHGEIRMA